MIRLEVEGAVVKIDLDATGFDEVTMQGFLWWADLLARAEREAIVLEAMYRRRRAEAMNQITSRNPKLAEWKARLLVEDTDAFQQWQQGLAEAKRNVIMLREIVEVLRARVPPSER